MKRGLENTKCKKCDYCDDYAKLKVKRDELYNYLCIPCYKNLDKIGKKVY